jgi:hypothetical protein
VVPDTVGREVMDWTFTPIVDPGTTSIVAFLGELEPSSRVGNNIHLLLLEPGTGSDWTTSGWASATTVEEAAAWVEATFGAGSLEFRDPVDPPAGAAPFPDPVLIDIAMLVTDPLLPLLYANADPEWVAAALAAAGHEVTPELAAEIGALASATPIGEATSATDVPADCLATLGTGLSTADPVTMSVIANHMVHTMQPVALGGTAPPLSPCIFCLGCDNHCPPWGAWQVSSAPDPSDPAYQLCTWTRTRQCTRQGKEFGFAPCDVCVSPYPQTQGPITKRRRITAPCPPTPGVLP